MDRNKIRSVAGGHLNQLPNFTILRHTMTLSNIVIVVVDLQKHFEEILLRCDTIM